MQKELGIKLAEGIDGNELLSNVVCGYTRDGIPYIKIRKFDKNSKEADIIKIRQFAGQLKDCGQTDLIIDIDDYVLRRAMTEMKPVLEASGNSFVVSINVSAKNIQILIY